MKASLVVDIKTVSMAQAREYRVPEGTKLLEWDFILVSDKETRQLRDELADEAMKKMGEELGRMKIIDGLPVPDVD